MVARVKSIASFGTGCGCSFKLGEGFGKLIIIGPMDQCI